MLDQRSITSVAVLFTLALAGAAVAQDKRDCTGLATTDDLANLVLGIVTGGRVAFSADQSDKPECPSARATCTRHAFVVGGDMVVIDDHDSPGAYTCVAFIDRQGQESDGWLPAQYVRRVPSTPRWIGRWKRDTTATIAIKTTTAPTAEIDGVATYGRGAATHTGDLSGVIDSRQAMQSFAASDDKQMPYEKAGEFDCGARIRQLGPYLFVSDNGNCGGANVTFSGLYRRR